IVGHELHAPGGAAVARRADLGAQQFGRGVLDAQLHQPHAERRQAPHPGGAVNDRVDARQPHRRKAVPTTGVEGAAKSRGSMGPAWRAAWPASTARANAPAICTGSRAWATAVLTST